MLYCDDLSFEGDDASYKSLKAVLDGSIAAAPENVLIYATSNRRHLLPEYQQENQEARVIDEELHLGAGSTDPAVRAEALRWARARGSRSGRVACQFARDWAGRQPPRPETHSSQ